MKVFCKDCARWYTTQADQCDVPACGLQPPPGYVPYGGAAARDLANPDFVAATGLKRPNFSAGANPADPDKAEFLKRRLDHIHFCGTAAADGPISVYGRPSSLNKDNSCPFFEKKKRKAGPRKVYACPFAEAAGRKALAAHRKRRGGL